MSGAQDSLLDWIDEEEKWLKNRLKAGVVSNNFAGGYATALNRMRERVAEAKRSIEDNARYFVNVQLFGGFVTMDIVPLEALKPLFGEFKVPEVKLGGSAPPTKEEELG